MSEYCQILFGTETREEAEKIIDALFDDKLVACADGFPIDARYSWEGKIVNEKRYQVVAYSKFELKEKIISLIRQVHTDEIPAIVFQPIEANREYLGWIEQSLDNKEAK